MELVKQNAPDYLTEAELVQLAAQDRLPTTLQMKLENLLTTPFVSNEATLRGVRPRSPINDQLGPFLRVGFWNIAQGVRLDDILWLWTDTGRVMDRLEAKGLRPGSKRYQSIGDALQRLQAVDLLLLNEVDLGLERSGYRDVTRELAEALGMNYAFGVEFVELAPLRLGIELFQRVSKPELAGEVMAHEGAPARETRPQARRCRGLHGNAILSRYPIRKARILRFAHQGYDWTSQERRFYSCLPLSDSVNHPAPPLLQALSYYQLRRGGRMALIADLVVPQLPEGAVTVVTTHLESRTRPQVRRQQMHELLMAIRETAHPVILAGDLNTSGKNSAPGRIHQELLKLVASGAFWSQMAPRAIPVIAWLNDFFKGVPHFWRIERDPTRPSPFSSNQERGVFEELEQFRFQDGGAFDFRGDRDRSVNQATGPLANSNERQGKGFVPTSRPRWGTGPIGCRKLDWMLVKPTIRQPRERGASYRFAPHFGRTLWELNRHLRLSDHHPILVDLPLEEPEAEGPPTG